MPVTVADLQRALDSFDWAAWRERLSERLGPWREATVDAAGADTVDDPSIWVSDHPGIEAFGKQYLAERVTQITDTTRERLADVLATAIEDAAEGDGLSVVQLGAIIASEFREFARSRAATIGQTETAYATNHGALFGYAAGGGHYVVVSDGSSDPECATADGQIWSITYALAHALEHPHCERSFSDISDDDALAQGIDQE